MNPRVALVSALAFLGLGNASATCYEEAGKVYGLQPQLIRAIEHVESRGNPHAVNTNKNGSEDLCSMQINSSHLAVLTPRHGITKQALLSDACLCVKTGAWILSDLFTRHGASWEAVGRYNAACTKLKGPDCERARMSYAWKVYKAYVALNGKASPANINGAPVLVSQRKTVEVVD